MATRVHPDDLRQLRSLARRMRESPGINAEADIRLRHADGSYRWIQLIGTDLRGNGSVRGVVWNGRDITDSRRLADELRHQATHDPLTGLPNRALLEHRLDAAAADDRIAILLLDLDGFKQVNDVHGHHAGDQVLITVAERLTAVVGEAGMAARLGGDEFAVLLPGADESTAGKLTAWIEAAVAEPITLAGGAEVGVGTSVGVAAGVREDAERILRDADAAMYRSKLSRRI
jgi:diguanylate cyclase (GGDEF)-like protein